MTPIFDPEHIIREVIIETQVDFKMVLRRVDTIVVSICLDHNYNYLTF